MHPREKKRQRKNFDSRQVARPNAGPLNSNCKCHAGSCRHHARVPSTAALLGSGQKKVACSLPCQGHPGRLVLSGVGPRTGWPQRDAACTPADTRLMKHDTLTACVSSRQSPSGEHAFFFLSSTSKPKIFCFICRLGLGEAVMEEGRPASSCCYSAYTLQVSQAVT